MISDSPVTTVSPVKVSTVNVNGVRAAAGKGMAAWLAGPPAHVVCLQETRAEPDEIPDGTVGTPKQDHHVATPGLAARARPAAVERAPSGRRSNHAPVTVVHA